MMGRRVQSNHRIYTPSGVLAVVYEIERVAQNCCPGVYKAERLDWACLINLVETMTKKPEILRSGSVFGLLQAFDNLGIHSSTASSGLQYSAILAALPVIEHLISNGMEGFSEVLEAIFLQEFPECAPRVKQFPDLGYVQISAPYGDGVAGRLTRLALGGPSPSKICDCITEYLPGPGGMLTFKHAIGPDFVRFTVYPSAYDRGIDPTLVGSDEADLMVELVNAAKAASAGGI